MSMSKVLPGLRREAGIREAGMVTCEEFIIPLPKSPKIATRNAVRMQPQAALGGTIERASEHPRAFLVRSYFVDQSALHIQAKFIHALLIGPRYRTYQPVACLIGRPRTALPQRGSYLHALEVDENTLHDSVR